MTDKCPDWAWWAKESDELRCKRCGEWFSLADMPLVQCDHCRSERLDIAKHAMAGYNANRCSYDQTSEIRATWALQDADALLAAIGPVKGGAE